MHIASLRVELEITDALTLKDKRHVVRGLLDRLRDRFNVGAAEVGDNDNVRFAQLAVVGVANDRRFLDRMMSKVLDTIESQPGAVLLEQDLEFL